MVQKLLFGCALAMLLGAAYNTSAQTPQFSFQGTGSNNVFPLGSTTSNRVQWVYTPSTHFPTAPAALITKVYFKSNGAITSTTITNLTIKLGPTSLSQFSGLAQPWAGGLTTVYSAPSTTFSGVAAGGWFSVTLPTPYLFDPSQNLIVEMSQTAYTSGITIVQEGTAAGARQWGFVTNSITTNSGTGRVNFGFDTTAAPACNATPTAGTTTAVATQVCPGNTIQLGLSGNSAGLGQTYQLQSSPTLAGPYTAVGTASTSPFATATATTTQYYRFRVSCGTGVDSSTPIQITAPGLFPGGTYTINNAQPTGGTNFNSFNAAVSAIACGIAGPVIFNVVNNATPYNEQFIMQQINNTSSANTITFNGNGATLSFSGTPSLPSDIFLNGTDWIRIKRLNIVETSAATGGVQMMNDANNNVVDSCFIAIDSVGTSTTFAGINISGSPTTTTTAAVAGATCDSITITNNTIVGGYVGISLIGGSSQSSAGNLIARNTVRNFYVYGMYIGYLNADVDENDIHRLTRANPSTFYGVFVTTGGVGVRVRKNTIHDPATAAPTTSISSYGVYHSGADGTAASPNEVSNNLIYNFKQAGAAYGMYNTGSDYVRYYHNTVSLDDSSTTATTGLTRGFTQITTSAANLELKNNIISVRRNTTGVKHAVYFGVAASTYSARNNLYFVTSPNSGGGIGYYNSTNYPTLSGYQTASMQDTGSVDMDPMFMMPSGSTVASYTPTATLADNLGIPVGIATDILGATRSITQPDAGAIEWNFTPPCATPTALADVAAATTANLSWTASVSTNVGYEYVVGTTPTMPTGAGLNVPSSPAFVTSLTPGTTYYWFVRTVCGPSSYSNWVMDSFTTCVPPPSTLIALGSPTPNATSICQGDTALLKAPGGTGNTYLFLMNGATAGVGASTDSVFRATQGGSYSVVVTNATGCYDTSDAVQVTINPLPTPLITQISTNQLTTGTFMSYQWNLAGAPVPGATSQVLTATVNGSYTVTVTDANGCRATSNPYNLTTVVSVAGVAGGAAFVHVFPNPTNGQVFIESSQPVSASVWTLDGRKLLEVKNAASVDLSGLSGGVYMLRLTDAAGMVLTTERLTKTN